MNKWNIINASAHRPDNATGNGVCFAGFGMGVSSIIDVDKIIIIFSNFGIACIKNSILRSKTQIADVGVKAAELKWNWGGHVCRMSDAQWAKLTTQVIFVIHWLLDDQRRWHVKLLSSVICLTITTAKSCHHNKQTQ